jgi:predicted PurR-regulated permease PerM
MAGETKQGIRQAGVIAIFVVILAFLWFSRKVMLLLFAGLLAGLVLTSMINLFKRIPKVGQKAGLALSLLVICGIMTGLILIAVPAVSGQFEELTEALPKRVAELKKRMEESSTVQSINRNLPDISNMMPSEGGAPLTKFFSSTFEAVSSLVFIVFTGIFVAASPQLYRKLVVKLFSPGLRSRADETITRVVCTLKYWLLGQSISMLLVGIVTGVALAIVGIPSAVALAIVAGVFEFIPFIGPLMAAIPAVLLALAEGPDKVLMVIAIFVVIQFFEGNILQPVVQRRAIDLPPVVTLVALLVFGSAFGLLGMFVATPLAAVILVLVEEVYLKGYLKTEDRLLEG